MEVFLQIIGVGFALFMLYITFTQFKRGELTSKDFALWGIAWVVLGLFVLFPDFLANFAGKLSIQGAMQFIILISIAFLLVVNFTVYRKMRRQEMKINKLITAVAIDNEKQEEKQEEKTEK